MNPKKNNRSIQAGWNDLFAAIIASIMMFAIGRHLHWYDYYTMQYIWLILPILSLMHSPLYAYVYLNECIKIQKVKKSNLKPETKKALLRKSFKVLEDCKGAFLQYLFKTDKIFEEEDETVLDTNS